MLQLPSYWLSRPPFVLDSSTRAAFDSLLETAAAGDGTTFIDYRLEAPRWAFLCYAAEERGFALHGSLNPGITLFEPRQPSDLRAFGAQLAVYAAADGIWPMYFAILDREKYPTTLMNACIRLESPAGEISPPYYFFSVGKHVIAERPYTQGAVYLLPRATFSPEPPFPFGEVKVHTAQLACFAPLKPFAKLAVLPEDFPFLEQMRAHDDDRLEEYAAALANGQPWPDQN
jgi:hypothetical protein